MGSEMCIRDRYCTLRAGGMHMTIKEIETLSGLPRANIRYYESEGLITPKRAENGYREYSQADAEVLLRVKLLRALPWYLVL